MSSEGFAKNLKWMASGSGALVPGLAFFTDYPPPLFPGISVITTALAGGLLFMVISDKSSLSTTDRDAKYRRRARWSLATALLLLMFYVVLLNWTTVLDQQSGTVRYQIGFGRMPFSLTQTGLTYLETEPDSPVTDWMLFEGAFRDRGPHKLWKPWTIYAAGTALMVTYFLGFTLWTLAFAHLAKIQSKQRLPEAG